MSIECVRLLLGVSLRVDLVVLPMTLGDVILGIDFVMMYRANIDCYHRIVALVTRFGSVVVC